MKHALVTGGTGFIGRHLVESLLDQGMTVTALVRDPGKARFLRENGVHILPGDLESVPDPPLDLDVVFHLAGMTKALREKDYYKVNRDGTANLIEALLRRKLRPRFVLLSSLAAAGPSKEGRPRREDDPPAPVSVYGLSKLGGENACLARRSDLPLSIVRVGAVYGPRDTDFLDYFKIIRLGILPVFGRKKRPMTVCYVRDLVRALLAVARAGHWSGEIFNVGHPRPCTFDELGRAAARSLGVRVRPVVIPLSGIYALTVFSEKWGALRKRPAVLDRNKFRQYLFPNWVLDVGKAAAELGFEAETSVEDGIRETMAWYRRAGWL
ncbi:MAG: NAD(P)-dependent oxidoreductase [Candidatus Aminicenantes bacterium]|nr:NAD(P)-dependent oxidoreductase [Candidatus Aminicenantes bacterium]